MVKDEALEESTQQTSTETDDKKKKTPGIVDYLQAPRRKKKNFVIMCYGSSFRPESASTVDGYLRANFKTLALSHPRSVFEFKRQFNRQITLLIFDDEFADLEDGLELVRELKERKSSSGVPTLFLTRRPEDLIESYNQILAPHQEMDDYLEYTKVPTNHLLSRITYGLKTRYRRRSRRYKVDIPVTFSSLAQVRPMSGQILDLSLHGCLLKTKDPYVFTTRDQVKVAINVSTALPHHGGDFLKLSTKVRRVFIAGDRVGLSFEHLSDGQKNALTEYLTGLVNAQVARRSRTQKGRVGRR